MRARGQGRLWAIAAGVIAGLAASAVWVAAEGGARGDLAGLALYVVGLGAFPFAVAWWRVPYVLVATIAILFALWLGLWGLLPAALVALGLVASFFFPPAALDRRAAAWPAGAVGAALLLLGLFALVVVPGPQHLVACTPNAPPSTNEAVFELIDDPHVSGIGGAESPGGLLLQLDNWPSDGEVDRLARRLEAIPGVERVSRDRSTACR